MIGIVAIFSIFLFIKEKVMAEDFFVDFGKNLFALHTFQETTFLSLVPFSPDKYSDVAQKIDVIVTAYSSTVAETDEFPLITASGEEVRDGIIANNMLPFGTKVRLPELFGEKIFVVKDRMNSRKSNYHVDVWQASYEEAKNFGAQITEMEILIN